MVKVQIEVEISDGHEIVDVVNLTAQYGGGPEYRIVTRPVKPFLIDGAPSDWPAWLKCDWVSKEDDGEIYFHYSKPQCDGTNWICSAGSECIDKSIIAIDIPGPWEQSLRENPRRKK